MVARLVAGALASAFAAKVAAELNDRSVLMQTAVQMQEHLETESDMMVRDFQSFLTSNQEGLRRLESEVGMNINVAEMLDADGLKPPQAHAAEPNEAVSGEGAAFPPELKEMMDEVRKNPPRMPSAGRVLSLLRQNVPSLRNVSHEAMDGIAKMTGEVADAVQRGSPMADKILEQLPAMFLMLNSKALFQSGKPAVKALGSGRTAWRQVSSNFKKLVGAPVQMLLNGFEALSKQGGATAQSLARAGAQQKEGRKPVCGSGPYIRLQVAPGVRFFPNAKTGYFLQANIGYEIGLQGPIPCFSQPVIELQLEKKEESGNILGINLGAAFKPFGNEPLKYFLYRDFNMYFKQEDAVTPVAGATGWKKTAIHNIVVGAGAEVFAPWVEAGLKMAWIPKETYEKAAGLDSFVVVGLGLKQEGFDFADYHASANCKLSNFLAGNFFQVDSMKLGYTLDEPGVSL